MNHYLLLPGSPTILSSKLHWQPHRTDWSGYANEKVAAWTFGQQVSVLPLGILNNRRTECGQRSQKNDRKKCYSMSRMHVAISSIFFWPSYMHWTGDERKLHTIKAYRILHSDGDLIFPNLSLTSPFSSFQAKSSRFP